MQRRRFYASPAEIGGNRILLSADESHHLLRVLRMTCGDEVFVFDGQGREYRCRFVDVEKQQALVEIVEALTDEVESPLYLTLAQALAKGEKFDLIVQKATELGVSRIVPLASEHADLRLTREQADKRVERWQRISLEALKQCGRRRLVAITRPLTPAEFLRPGNPVATGARSTEAFLFFNERGGALIQEAVKEARDTGAITALIGPEGGWSDAEIELMTQQGGTPVTLGKRIVRAETAALVAVTLLQYLLGDLSRASSDEP